MPLLTGRDYCLRNPAHTLRAYGIGVFLAALLKQNGSLLQLLSVHYAAHGFAMPGAVGRAYRLSALLEFRMAQLYRRLAIRFADTPEAAALFRTLSEEEEEHGRLMELCRYTVLLEPGMRTIPRLRDAGIRTLLQRLRQLRRQLDGLSLDEALQLTEELEQGEINVIFDQLLRQAEGEATRPFAAALAQAEGHARTVPQRIAHLRQRSVA